MQFKKYTHTHTNTLLYTYIIAMQVLYTPNQRQKSTLNKDQIQAVLTYNGFGIDFKYWRIEVDSRMYSNINSRIG